MIKPNTFGVYQFIRNGDFYDYPWRESLLSAVPIADEIVVAECYSDKDNTFEELEKFALQYPNIKVVRHPWIDHFTNLCIPANFAATHLKTEWIMQLQADEVLHENSYEEIERIKTESDKITTAYITHYTHMLANYETEFDFCYRQLIRIARKGTGWRLVGDACQLDGGNINTIRDSEVHVFHYGKVHNYEIGFRKEVDFQQLYVDIGFPDPKMNEMKEKLGSEKCDYLYLFQESIKQGKVRKFLGTHPYVMRDRILKFKQNGWEQFQSIMDLNIKL